jgi:hypothetical protein
MDRRSCLFPRSGDNVGHPIMIHGLCALEAGPRALERYPRSTTHEPEKVVLGANTSGYWYSRSGADN